MQRLLELYTMGYCPHEDKFLAMWLNAIGWKKEEQHTQSFKHLHPSILSFKQNSIVKWVEGTAHSHQNHFQAA